MKINEVFMVVKQDLFAKSLNAYDILEWRLMSHKLNLRNGEIVKVTIEKVKEL
jgi:hypothetical protein